VRNAVDLAIAVVIGAAFAAVVQALVEELITALIGAFGAEFYRQQQPLFDRRFFLINSLLAFVIIGALSIILSSSRSGA
jgi:large-conductance mechanosensitive channel